MSRLHLLLSLSFLSSFLLLAGCNAHRAPIVPLSPMEAAALHHRVLVGMDSGQVRRAWDDPCEKHTSTTAAGTSEVWTYCMICPSTARALRLRAADCQKMRTVAFGPDGKVVEVQQ